VNAAKGRARHAEQPGTDVSVLVAERLLVAGLREHEHARAADMARQRLEYLAHASEQLAASLEYSATLKTIVGLVVPDFADGCVVSLLGSDQRLVQAAVSFSDRLRRTGNWERWVEQTTRRRLRRVMRTGQAELGSRRGTCIESTAIHAPPRCKISYAVVPLPGRGRIIGTLSLFRLGRLAYGSEEMALAIALGARAGLAVDNARLYEV
jgi:GAF domain-containing protein